VSIPASGTKAELQLYVRVLFSVVAVFPDISEAPAHNGALPQLPRGTQSGQEALHKPDEQVLVPVAGTKVASHVYIQVFPLTDTVVFGHIGGLPQPTQLGQLLTQLPSKHSIFPVFGTKLASQSYVRILP